MNRQPPQVNIMSNDLVTPDNLSKELLHSMFNAAFIETSWDEDGDLIVKDRISCYVMPTSSGNQIKMLSLFGFKENASEIERLKCVNNINDRYIITRAVVTKKQDLSFDYDLSVKGGVTPKNVVLATKLFLQICIDAAKEHEETIDF